VTVVGSQETGSVYGKAMNRKSKSWHQKKKKNEAHF